VHEKCADKEDDGEQSGGQELKMRSVSMFTIHQQILSAIAGGHCNQHTVQKVLGGS
jgi:hypothetical protein